MKRYAVLLAARDTEYMIKTYKGYFNMFVQAFGDEEENWEPFRVIEREFPEVEELDKYDGFVISGSPHDAYANDFWILRLCFLIEKLHVMQKRILGVCFGHQILCRALGGQVGKSKTGWDIGVRRVIMKERFLHRFEEIPSSAKILECHQDEVQEVPPGAEVLAFSDKTNVEIFCIGRHILGIQGHPEYTKDILLNRIDHLTSNELLDREFCSNAREQLEADDAERDFWEKLCKSFLKGL